MKNPVFDIENWREIGATLSQNPTRTFMTAFGIFWGTAILSLLLGGADGLKHFMNRNFEGFATNTAALFPGHTTKSYRGFNKGQTVNFNLTDLAYIRRAIPDIIHSSPVNFNHSDALYGSRKSSCSISGVEASYSNIFEPTYEAGRFINESDVASSRKVCVIGRQVAEELFGLPDSAVGHDIRINDIYYKVVGVVSQSSEVNIGSDMNETVYIPSSTMRLSYNTGDKVDIIMLNYRDGARPADYEQLIRHIISSNHPIAPDDTGAFYYFNISEMFEMVDNVFLGISLLAIFVGAGTLLSGVIGVGNIMWIIVRERTHEIGIRRALGAKPRDIIIQILSESMVLTTLAGLAGIVFAAAILGGAELLSGMGGRPLEFQLSFAQASGVLVTFMVLGTAAGIIPALKAMRIKPIEALNDK